MKAKVRVVKRKAPNDRAHTVEAQVGADPKKWSTAVKSWVKEFRAQRGAASLDEFNRLFDDSPP
ncbi:MAG TPA: hypothetical protein VK208_21970 [Pyrinomonadaceae bacterium]|jgi:hypothetical protein|nr:hypothetical protein [Pyrinomonadaceae bacterium]